MQINGHLGLLLLLTVPFSLSACEYDRATKVSGGGPLCDSASGLRLRVYGEAQSSREVNGSAVRVENGLPSLAVDGSCRYWINAGWTEDALARDRGWRTGILPGEISAALDTAIGSGNLGNLDDCPSATAVADSTPRMIANAGRAVRCVSSGRGFEAAWSVVSKHSTRLWSAGTPVTEGIHIVATLVPDQPPNAAAPLLWPSSVLLSSFLLPDPSLLTLVGVSQGVSTTDASWLRMLREQYLRNRSTTPDAYLTWDGPIVTDGQITALLFLRDALPFEDGKGLWPSLGSP